MIFSVFLLIPFTNGDFSTSSESPLVLYETKFFKGRRSYRNGWVFSGTIKGDGGSEWVRSEGESLGGTGRMCLVSVGKGLKTKGTVYGRRVRGVA